MGAKTDKKRSKIDAKMRPNFALVFGSMFDRFWTLNRLQNQSKVNQTILPKSTYKQALFQLHLRSNFEENLMFKQNGRCAKIVPKHSVFVCFLNIRSCQRKQTRDMQRIQKSSKTTSKINEWWVQVGVIFLCFWGVCFKIVF